MSDQENKYITRIQHTHDTETNWKNVEETFTPMKGEIIVYDIDTTKNGSQVRFKIGDGDTELSKLPFAGISKINDIPVDISNSITLTAEDIQLTNNSEDDTVGEAIEKLLQDVDNLFIENDNTKEELAKKANTAKTLEGYGITDAYTKDEVDTELSKKLDKSLKVNNQPVGEDNAITLTGKDIQLTNNPSKGKVSDAIITLQSNAIYSVNNVEVESNNAITLNSSNIDVDITDDSTVGRTITAKLNSLQSQISSIQGGGNGAAILKINGETPTDGEVTLTAENIFRKDNNPNNNSVAKEITELTQTVTNLNNNKSNRDEVYLKENEVSYGEDLMLVCSPNGDITKEAISRLTDGLYRIALTYFNIRKIKIVDGEEVGPEAFATVDNGAWSTHKAEPDNPCWEKALYFLVMVPDSTFSQPLGSAKSFKVSIPDEAEYELTIQSIKYNNDKNLMTGELDIIEKLKVYRRNDSGVSYRYSAHRGLTITKIMSF